MLLPQPAVSTVWPNGPRCPVEASGLAPKRDALSVPSLWPVGVGAHGHGLLRHTHGSGHFFRGATALAEGISIRATRRMLGVDKDTVNHWLPVLGRHCQGVMNYFFRNFVCPENLKLFIDLTFFDFLLMLD